MNKKYDCIVIGAGVAGMTAALYLKRSNLDVLLLERDVPGGQMNKTTEIENYPGFLKVNGSDLALTMLEQVKAIGVDYRYGNVVDVIDHGSIKIVKTEKEEYTSPYVIIAGGRVPRKLGLPNEEKLISRGISYCAICDGYFYKNKTVAVVGGGNSAFTGALYLAGLAKKVYLLNRSETLRADEIFIEKAKQFKNIEILYRSQITEIMETENRVSGIAIHHDLKLDVDGIFIYIGFDPDISYLSKLQIENKQGYLIVDRNMKTSIDGIYACGDIILKDVYQISTAIGDAAIAATSVKSNL